MSDNNWIPFKELSKLLSLIGQATLKDVKKDEKGLQKDLSEIGKMYNNRGINSKILRSKDFKISHFLEEDWIENAIPFGNMTFPRL